MITVTVELPVELYERLKEEAERAEKPAQALTGWVVKPSREDEGDDVDDG
jgi:hypothetical protein